jgi:CBS domain-containing protein
MGRRRLGRRETGRPVLSGALAGQARAREGGLTNVPSDNAVHDKMDCALGAAKVGPGPGGFHGAELQTSRSEDNGPEVLTSRETIAMSNYGVISAILNHKGHQVWSISQDATVFEAIKMMADKNVGALLALDGTSPIGIVSERDYARKVDLKGKSSQEVRVGDIISKKLITATSKNTVEECMRLMSSHRVRHLPVIEEGRVMGIVSIGDLVNWIIHAQTETIIQLESYITGHYPE